MGRTGLTRKALYYYEEIGIVKPLHDPANDYRDYSLEDVRMLATVSSLLQLGVEVGDISRAVAAKDYLDEADAAGMLRHRQTEIERAIGELERQRNLIEVCIEPDSTALAERLAVAARAAVLDERERASFLRNQLLTAFPGHFGRAMGAIFAPFLAEPVDTPEKERAWICLVEAIDEADPVVLPDAVQSLAEGIDDRMSLLQEIDAVSWELQGEDARLAVRTAEYLVHHAGSFLEPFFGYLEVLSSRFRSARRTLLRIARSLEEEIGG